MSKNYQKKTIAQKQSGFAACKEEMIAVRKKL
jgi:hypothetical protein